MPRATVTSLARVWPLVQFRFEALGGLVPAGWIVRYPGPEVSVTVALSTTAAASAGTPASPATGT